MQTLTISIGQYIPGKSLFHRADPRTKILWTFTMMVLILIVNNIWGYVLASVFVLGSLAVSKIPPKMIVKSLKPMVVFIIFTVFFNLLFFQGDELILKLGFVKIYLEGIIFSAKMIVRIILLVSSATLLTFTTTSVNITDGLESLMRPLEKIKVPVHDIAMMMSIALRFIPTFAEETDKIMKAQASRGADFETGNIFTRIKSYVPLLVPLVVGAFKRAEDMATAMESRCYRGGEGRTKFRVLTFGKSDLVILIGTVLFTAAIILLNVFL